MSWFRPARLPRVAAALLLYTGLVAGLPPVDAIAGQRGEAGEGATRAKTAAPPEKSAAKAQRVQQSKQALKSKRPRRSAQPRQPREAQPSRQAKASTRAQLSRRAVPVKGDPRYALRAPSGGAAARARQSVVFAQPGRISLGQAIGLRAVHDPLSLRSSVALVLDQATGEVLFQKNAQAVLPIASISKLMTALVVLDAGLPLSETVEVTAEDVDTERNTRSRLGLGTRLSRGELLQLALMSSENRAAHALGRNYPGGMQAFVEQMNRKARELGMSNSRFVEPTGLSSRNVSNARDLALLVRTASDYPLIREYSTASGLRIDVGRRTLSYRNTNRLVGDPDWDIGLQKTGYISEAGNCVVMQASIEGRPMVMVLLDAQARAARFGDAQRLRQWLERAQPRPAFESAPPEQRAGVAPPAQVSRDS